MPSLLYFRRRIRSVKNTQQITRAMKFVAAARLRRAQESALAARPYANELARVLRSTMARIDEAPHPLLAKRRRTHSPYSSPVSAASLALSTRTSCAKPTNFCAPIATRNFPSCRSAKRGRDSLKRAGSPLPPNTSTSWQSGICNRSRNRWLSCRHAQRTQRQDSVYLIFSEFKTVITRISKSRIAAGRTESTAAETSAEPAVSQIDYIYEQPRREIVGALLPKYVEAQLLRAMLESSAAEYAARMAAMESATRNAGEVIQALTLHMNKVRQAAITKEIIEIVSGASHGA
jgi:F-type H+-transporting ATPase subunit gamma